MTSNIKDRVIELAAEHSSVPRERITPEHHFVNDLEFDSLQEVEFAMDVEDEFEISVPDENLKGFKTVGQVIEFVEQHHEPKGD